MQPENREGASVLDRTREQKLAALELANETRFARARLKKQIAAGAADVVGLIEQPPDFCMAMRVEKLLFAVDGFGPVRVRKIMRRAEIADSKTLGGLSGRQRVELVRLMGGRTA